MVNSKRQRLRAIFNSSSLAAQPMNSLRKILSKIKHLLKFSEISKSRKSSAQFEKADHDETSDQNIQELPTQHSEDQFRVRKTITIGKNSYCINGDSYLSSMGDEFEPGLKKAVFAIGKLFREPGTALDIGGNIGMTALLLSQNHDVVYSYEPSPRTYKILVKNIKSNHVSNIQAMPYGLGESNKTLSITAASDNASGGFISNTINQLDGHITEQCQIKNGDFAAENIRSNINTIKIDVEGNELNVLSGLRSTLIKHQPIVILEMNHWCLYAFQRTSIPDFLDEVFEYSNFILAYDDATGQCRRIGPQHPSSTYGVMHDHIVKNLFPTLILFNSIDELEKFENLLRSEA